QISEQAGNILFMNSTSWCPSKGFYLFEYVSRCYEHSQATESVALRSEGKLLKDELHATTPLPVGASRRVRDSLHRFGRDFPTLGNGAGGCIHPHPDASGDDEESHLWVRPQNDAETGDYPTCRENEHPDIPSRLVRRMLPPPKVIR